MLSGINQTQEDKYCTIPLLRSTWSGPTAGDRKKKGSCQRKGEERNEELVGRISLLKHEKVLAIGCTIMSM